MNRCARFMVLFLSVMVFLPGSSSAEEKITGRIVLHYNKMESIDVGDNIPGHRLGVGQQAGLVLYSTGGIARKTATFTFDLVNGQGTFVVYDVITDQDGSTLVAKGAGTATPLDGGKKFSLEGKLECIGGTGRYEGFKGTGTFKGERIGDLKTGGDAYYDFTMNCGRS